jgi:hypothetical protein
LNIPLPESGYRFRDVVLHDGASTGTRTQGDRKYPVFDSLSLWQKSDYSTFEISVNIPDQPAEDRLVELCREKRFGIEDWSTVRMICAECSRGNPAPHDCMRLSGITRKPYAIAAKSEDDVRMLMTEWVVKTPGAEYGSVDLVLSAETSSAKQ